MQFETDDCVGQCGQTGALRLDDLARAKELGKVYKEVIGKNYPASTLAQRAAQVKDRGNANLPLEA